MSWFRARGRWGAFAPTLALAFLNACYQADFYEAGASGSLDPAPVNGGAAAVGGTASGGASGATAIASGVAVCSAVTEQRLRRLTSTEYAAAVASLTGTPPFTLSLPDPTVHGFDNNADALSITDGNFDDYAISAQLAAEELDVDTLAPCPTDGLTCARAFAEPFALLAYGRRVPAAELERLLELYRSGANTDYATGIRTMVEGVLLSPYFLYRTELGDAAEATSPELRLTAYEAASALSFALTGERPDVQLLELAGKGDALFEPSSLRAEATRLANSDAGHHQLSRFLRDLFGVVDIKAVNKEPVPFPIFTPKLKADMDRELELFLGRAVADGGTVASLLGATSTFMNRNLYDSLYAADYAGSASPPVVPDTGEFVEVPFNPKLRRGLLGLAGWEAAHSTVNRTSPVDRAVNILSRLFCVQLTPPPGLTFTAPSAGDTSATTRQKFERHTQDPNCQTCHHILDPLGFGLELIDTLGAYRTQENTFPVDSSGALIGTDVDGSFTGPAELSARLLESREVRACLVTQLFRFVEGRDDQPADACVLDPLKSFFAAGDRSLAELEVEMALSPKFFQRRRER